MKIFEKLQESLYLVKVLSTKLKILGYSYLEAQFAAPRLTLTTSPFWVANIKLDEKKTLNSSWKIEKHFNHCNIRYSLIVQKFFRKTCKNNTLKKLKHGEIVKPASKYKIDNLTVLSVFVASSDNYF